MADFDTKSTILFPIIQKMMLDILLCICLEGFSAGGLYVQRGEKPVQRGEKPGLCCTNS